MLERRNAAAGPTLSNPAMKTCVCQRKLKVVWSSKCGKRPTTDSSRSHHSRRNRRSLCNRDSLCSHDILCSRRSRAKPPVRH
jgi:hypothetical protein